MFNIAATNRNLSRYSSNTIQLCPICCQEGETCAHILSCNEVGRVAALRTSISLLDKWLQISGMDNTLRTCIVQYLNGRGGTSMMSIVRFHGERYQKCGSSQDKIGWRRMLEGMISNEIIQIQKTHLTLTGIRTPLATWLKTLVKKYWRLHIGNGFIGICRYTTPHKAYW